MTIQIEDEEQPQARREERRQGGAQSETRTLRGGAGR